MSILPAAPSKYVYNDPAFYTQILPPEYIGNRRAELMYGEMRLARYMYVFREHMKYWLSPEAAIRDDSNLYMEFDTDAKFLSLWFCIDDRRKLAWPSMVALVDRYIEEVYGRYQYGRDEWRFPDMVEWIDSFNGTVWQTLIVDNYNRLVAGVNYKDLDKQPAINTAERKETTEPGTLRLLVEYDEWIELIHLLSEHLSEGGMSDEQLDHLHDILEYRPNHNTHPRSIAVYLEEPSGTLVVEVTAYGCKSAAQRFTPTPELLKHLHTLK